MHHCSLFMYLCMACDPTHKHIHLRAEQIRGGGGYSRNFFGIGVCRKGSQNLESVSLRMKQTQIDSILRHKPNNDTMFKGRTKSKKSINGPAFSISFL